MSRRETRSSRGKDKNAECCFPAAQALKRGEVIVFPTETFYGLGADALNETAVERVFSFKGRNPDNPIAVIVADQEMLAEIVTAIPPLAQRLMDRFWPGPLTLVLPAKKKLPQPLLNRDGSIGVRISSHPLAMQLARELGRPLTATSANLSGMEPARTVQEARVYFSGKVEIFVDGGMLTGKKGSSVVEVFQNELKIIREGEINSEQLRTVAR